MEGKNREKVKETREVFYEEEFTFLEEGYHNSTNSTNSTKYLYDW